MLIRFDKYNFRVFVFSATVVIMSERFEHKKSLGQNFLNNRNIPAAMCDAASVAAGETVVEIGPGTGALTEVLLERGARVIALEADERAVAILA